jgi:hypothetical protein
MKILQFLLVFFCFSSVIADEVAYGGISFECPKTCGIPYKDNLADEIYETLLDATGRVFNWQCGLTNRYGGWEYLPEEFRPQLTC